MTKKKVRRARSISDLAHSYACRAKPKAPEGWNDGEKGTYWWGLYDGYQAGVRAARRKK